MPPGLTSAPPATRCPSPGTLTTAGCRLVGWHHTHCSTADLRTWTGILSELSPTLLWVDGDKFFLVGWLRNVTKNRQIEMYLTAIFELLIIYTIFDYY